MLNVLFIHQSADMYGSDKVLLSLVLGLDRNLYKPIVILPSNGPMLKVLEECGIEHHIVPLVRIGRTMLNLKGFISLPLIIWKSIRALNKTLKSMRIDIVHSNTLGVLSGAIWAWSKGIFHVWHVHEIIEQPLKVRKGFALLLRFFANWIICNSHATKEHLLLDQPRLQKKTVVVWNGIERTKPVDLKKVEAFRAEFGIKDDEVLVVLLGRINRWKGQRLLVEAAEHLKALGKHHIRYLIVGSPPDGQDHFMQSLKTRVNQSSAKDNISILSFTSDIWTVWDACDIAVVPSTEPEPFGMVALEAMVSGKPVVAASHGGLAEIVIPGKTGLLFTPGNSNDLADAIETLAANQLLREELGRSGKLLAAESFSATSYVAGVSSIYNHAKK